MWTSKGKTSDRAGEHVRPSSSTAGFFQERPIIKNQLYDDIALRRVLELYLPPLVQHSITPDLSRFGDVVLSRKVLDWIADAEKNPPYLRTWDTFGRRKDELVTSEGWRRLQALGIEEGIVAIAYEKHDGPYSRLHQFLKYHIWSGSCAYVTCPSAMTDGAASLLSRHLSDPSLSATLRPVLQSAYKRLTARDPARAWTSGQWMTERSGGSDVSGTETLAMKADTPLDSKSVDGSPLGPYTISGFKWFSSATDANMAILLARTPSGTLSAFYAPMQRTLLGTDSNATELNGLTLQRLKSKLGTRTLPTAELVLHDLRAYRLGAEGSGVREIATILNITRVHNAVTALGFWGRGLAVSRAFARVRKVAGGRGGKRRLVDVPAHVATLAGMQVTYRGWMHLTFFAVLLLGIAEQPLATITPPVYPPADSKPQPPLVCPPPSLMPPSAAEATTLLRVLTPVIKALTAKAAIAGLAECMESLGGVGYLENEEMEFNIARLFRDACVLSIWEGTTEIMASDVLRAVKGRGGAEAMGVLGDWMERVAGGEMRGSGTDMQTLRFEMRCLMDDWAMWRNRVEGKELEELLVSGREIMSELGRIVAGILLCVDAGRDGGDEITREVARRWVGRAKREETPWKERIIWDRRIVFGDDDEKPISKL